MAADEDEDMPSDNPSPSDSKFSHSHSLSLSPRKRPRAAVCPSSADIPLATKKLVISRSNSKCWLCGLNGRHVTHVIPRSDHLIFNDLRASNLLTFTSLHSFSNLIYLCPGCHTSYNKRLPAWTFLPSDLDPFLAAEQEYHDQRLASFPTPVPRSQPPQTTRYTRYQIRPGYVFTDVFRHNPTKEWGGSPVAAMTRSAGIFCGVKRLGARMCGIPDDVAAKLQRLLWMYGMADPEVPRVIQEAADREDEDRDGDDDDWVKKQGNGSLAPLPSPPAAGPSIPPPGETRKTTTPPAPGKHHQSEQRGRAIHGHLPLMPPKSKPAAKSKLSRRRRKGEMAKLTDAAGEAREAEWVYGPQATANQVSDWFRTARW